MEEETVREDGGIQEEGGQPEADRGAEKGTKRRTAY